MAGVATMSYYNKPRVTLPVTHSEKDDQWLSEQLLRLHPKHRTTACIGYSDAFREAFENEQVEHKKENAGRKAANTRMRKFVEKCLFDQSQKVANQAVAAYNQNEYKPQQNQTNFSIDSL
ncbi:MAG: hypothetical protein CMM15_14565 [Rhodospirillaceae bacterium]|nr:hypothetical protein [Rhodospirillaceae bacterium]